MDLSLSATSLPSGTLYPATPQALLTLIGQYMAISGQETLGGFVTGLETPDTDDRDKIWFRLDASDNFIGMHYWAGDDWEILPPTIGYGDTASRPADPARGMLYYDTDIKATIRYNGSQWVTNDGLIGEVRMVRKVSGTIDTIDDVLERYPGWIECTELRGRVPIGAGTGTGLTERTAGTDVGAEQVTLTKENLPPHRHTYDTYTVVGVDTEHKHPHGRSEEKASGETGSGTDDGLASDPFDIIPPARVVWFITKTAD